MSCAQHARVCSPACACGRRCRVPVEQALKDANLKLTDINEVILVGGSTRIPAVQVCHLSASCLVVPC